MKVITKISILFILISVFYGCGEDENLNLIDESGNIECNSVVIASKSSGEITKINFDEGDKIKEGDTLLVVDITLPQIQLKQAEAAKIMAEAQYSLVSKGARIEDKNLASELLNEAKANFSVAEKDYERMKKLFELKSITEQQFELISARYESAQAKLNSARENAKKINSISRPEEIQQAKANFMKACAAVELAQKQLNDSYVTSPISGLIIEKYLEKGETVMPMTSLAKIADLETVEVSIYVKETLLPLIKLGGKAEIFTDTFADKSFTGKITYVSSEAEFTPKNIQTKDERTKLVFRVKIKIENPDLMLKIGMPVDVKINLSEK